MSPPYTRGSADAARLALTVRGSVQGVGFRPYVQRLGVDLGLCGSVQNDAGGVRIEVEGSRARIAAFLAALRERVPATARVESIDVAPLAPTGGGLPPGHGAFAILPSTAEGAAGPLPLDVATCDACRAELFRRSDRRYRYPFLSCALCGPRYSIVETFPWDRANTTMRRFSPCAACAAEYADSKDRRFHAQTNACAACGPRLELRDARGAPLAQAEPALACAVQALREGAIVALKGLGGFQLLVDATHPAAVAELRRRKHRAEKPLAVMVVDARAAAEICHISAAEAALLGSPAAPIVLLQRRALPGRRPIAPAVAPDNPDLGVMLPCTPLHHLLLDGAGAPLVATSGNRSGDPICHDEREAAFLLGGVADLFLVHDRPIAHPIDDSVVRVFRGETCVLRAARGYAPITLSTPTGEGGRLGLGAFLNNTIAVAASGRAHLSPHIGDLRSPRTRALAARTAEWLARVFERGGDDASRDLVPDRPLRRVADLAPARTDASEEEVRVQHHHAHVLACMAENGIDEAILGVAWDGNGHGPDGTVWGGEFLLCDRSGYERFAHLRTFRLPGAERAILEGRRSALGILFELYGASALHDDDLAPVRTFGLAERRTLERMLVRGINAPFTSSIGRLFDAVASLLDLRHRVSFEGQAAMALEFAARAEGDARRPRYHVALEEKGGGAAVANWAPLVAAVLGDVRAGLARGRIAAGFHDALADLVVAVARRAGRARVALAGGCFQNQLLLARTIDRLRAAGFEPLYHRRVPPNDGAIALGQVVYAGYVPGAAAEG